jgi:hypothetical protein
MHDLRKQLFVTVECLMETTFLISRPVDIVHLGSPVHHSDNSLHMASLRSSSSSGSGTSNGSTAAPGNNRPTVPDAEELERRFNQVLLQMDLPPESARRLRSLDDAKKWEVVCDQERVHARDPPSTYLAKIRTYLDPRASKKEIRSLGDDTSTQVLRNLEISLRTNNIEWVREFLSSENHGLDVLVDFLAGRLLLVMPKESGGSVAADAEGSSSGGHRSSKKVIKQSSTKARLLGDTTDDIHVCIMCLRAIMNNKYGFNMVIQHKHAINCIALSLVLQFI